MQHFVTGLRWGVGFLVLCLGSKGFGCRQHAVGVFLYEKKMRNLYDVRITAGVARIILGVFAVPCRL